MFILKAKQVKPCRLHTMRKGEKVTINGIIYRKWLFMEGESFNHSEKAKAFKKAQTMLEEQQKTPLLLDNGVEITLYYYQRALNPEKDIKESPYRNKKGDNGQRKQIAFSLAHKFLDCVDSFPLRTT